MNFADERWVRLYVTDTSTWELLGWQGRCVLVMLLRKVDRAGVRDVPEDERERIEVLAAALKLPEEVVEPGLVALLKRKVAVLQGDRLILPRFMEAQYCRGRRANSAPDTEQRRFAARRRRIYSSGLARRIFDRDRFACRYCCRAEPLTVDHVVPLVGGGCDSESNLVAACRPCNSRKGGRTPERARMPLKEVSP